GNEVGRTLTPVVTAQRPSEVEHFDPHDRVAQWIETDTPSEDLNAKGVLLQGVRVSRDGTPDQMREQPAETRARPKRGAREHLGKSYFDGIRGQLQRAHCNRTSMFDLTQFNFSDRP